MTQELAIYRSIDDTMTLGKLLAQSGYFADSRDAGQAVVKVLAGAELGFGPIASMTGINIIKGKVTLSANLIAAAIKRSGRYNYRVRKMTDTECEIVFFEGKEEIGVSTFTAKDAANAGLSGDNWRKFPRNMLFARAISNGAKWYCPDLSGGPLYTPDELGATVDGETGEVIDAPAPRIVVEQPKLQPAKCTCTHLADGIPNPDCQVHGALNKPKPQPATNGNSKQVEGIPFRATVEGAIEWSFDHAGEAGVKIWNHEKHAKNAFHELADKNGLKGVELLTAWMVEVDRRINAALDAQVAADEHDDGWAEVEAAGVDS